MAYLTDYAKNLNDTPQSEPIPMAKTPQVANSAGGYSWAVDDWTRLDRFCVLGAEGGTYYISQQKLTKENAEATLRCIKTDGPRAVRRIAEISEQGRAPRQQPAIFALALASVFGDMSTKRLAYDSVTRVCRTASTIMTYVQYVTTLKPTNGWSRGLRRAVGTFYTSRDARSLAYQVTKYRERDGWSNDDLLRASHAESNDLEVRSVLNWVTGRPDPRQEIAVKGDALTYLDAFEELQHASSATFAAQLIKTFRLPRECVPTNLLKETVVWEALLEDMPLTAMIRNLATMTRIGLIKPMAPVISTIKERVTDADRLKQARVHPVAILTAMLTYQSGRSQRGDSHWDPEQRVIDALDQAFYLAFGAVQPTNKRMLLALDISGSMSGGECAGVRDLTPRVGSAAMALVTANVEQNYHFIGFTSGNGRATSSRSIEGITQLAISPRQRLDDVVGYTAALPMGGTDCALPMLWA